MLKSVFKYSSMLLVSILLLRLTIWSDDKPIKHTTMILDRTHRLPEGDLLLPTGELQLSGVAKINNRKLNMDHLPHILPGPKFLSELRYKKIQTHSWANNDQIVVFTIVDKSYSLDLTFLYYNFKTETFFKATEQDFALNLLLNTEKRWNRPQEDFWKVGDKFNLRNDSSKYNFRWEVEAYPNKDENGQSTGKIEYKFTLVVKSQNVILHATVVKPKKYDQYFVTIPHYDDKRYWSKNQDIMGQPVNGTQIIDDKIIVLSDDKTDKWQYIFDDLSGVFAYRSYILRTWTIFNNVPQSDENEKQKKQGKGHFKPEKLNIYTGSGQIHDETAKAETDVIWVDNKSYFMEPILQWPNTNDLSDPWRFQTHGEDRVDKYKFIGDLDPVYQDLKYWDLGIQKQDDRFVFHKAEINQLNLDDDDDTYRSVKNGVAFTWYFYAHW